MILQVYKSLLQMDPNERKRKAPPLPKFQEPGMKNSQMVDKVTDFLQEISKQVSTQQQTQKPNAQPVTQSASSNTQGDKKKFNLASINSKLNSIMSTKKIDLNKVVQNSKKTTQTQEQPKSRRDIEIQYDPAHPNSYEQSKSHYTQMFQKMRKGKNSKKDNDDDQKISKMIAQYEKNGAQIQQQTIEQPIVETHALDDGERLALRMMQKQGFKIGQGLGKQSQGIRTPLTIKKLTDSSCKIEPSTLSLANFVTLQQSAQNALKAFKIQKSPVIALRITMELNQLTQQVEVQIKQECVKYGEIKQWIALSTKQAIIFFCQYNKIQEAFKAFTRINGRYYDEKIINVFFYPKQLLENKNFTASLHQVIEF